jgi:uncharacterized protein (TIRG00374 family)
MLRHSRRYLLLLLGVLALGYFLYKFRNSITLEGFRWAMVGKSIHQARPGWLFLSVVTIYLCYAIRAVRWKRFCRWLGEVHFANVYGATLMGFACAFLLGRAAEPIRPVLIARRNSVSMPGMFGVYVLERVFDMAATALLAVFALLSFNRHGVGGSGNEILMTIARSAGAVLLVAQMGIIGFLVYFRYHGAAWLAGKLQRGRWRTGWREKAAVLLEGFSEGLQGIRTWGDLAALSFYTALHWALVVVVYVLIVHAFPGKLSTLTVSDIVLVVAFTLVGSAAQAPALGGGSQAATFLVLKLIFGVQPEPAAVASIVIWLVTFASCTLAGLPLLLKEGWSMGELRRIARTEARAEEAQLLADAEHAGARKDGPR